jgi:hypothetical protein
MTFLKNQAPCMSCPLRGEYPGAFFHFASRGNEHKSVFISDGNRQLFLKALHQTSRRFNWHCHVGLVEI